MLLRCHACSAGVGYIPINVQPRRSERGGGRGKGGGGEGGGEGGGGGGGRPPPMDAHVDRCYNTTGCVPRPPARPPRMIT